MMVLTCQLWRMSLDSMSEKQTLGATDEAVHAPADPVEAAHIPGLAVSSLPPLRGDLLIDTPDLCRLSLIYIRCIDLP